MEFNKFVAGLKAFGMPNEYAVWIAYAVEAGQKSQEFRQGAGQFGLHELLDVIKRIEARG